MKVGWRRVPWWALAATLALALAPVPAQATAPDAESQATLDRSVRFLQEAQNPDGGFGGRLGAPSDPDFSAWAAYALAAAGINPQDQTQPGGVDVFSYLTEHTAGLVETTDFDRVALVALASGTSPFAFGTVAPIETILSRQLPDGSFAQQAGGKTGWVNATVWSIFPLSALEGETAETAARRAAQWLLGEQRADGSWGASLASSPSESDMTGAAIQALAAAGLDQGEAVARALTYLRSLQGEDGGFREFAGSAANSASTAWALQGLWAAGADPRAWRTTAGADPLSFLASLQRPDGSIGWTADQDLNPLWMTAQAGPALAGMTYPLPAVPRAVKAKPVEPAPSQGGSFGKRKPGPAAGHGGAGLVKGDGVIAGGGGHGAPLFSAPQPQSTGSIPHGERQVGRQLPVGHSGSAGAARSQASASGEAAPVPHIGVLARTRGQSVEGVLVAGRGVNAAAPGLFAADRGGEREAATGAVVVLLALALAAGWRRERGRLA
jgi:prenyltransferase beta subunit